MIQMPQMNPTVQLEAELTAGDFIKGGVPAFTEVELTDSIGIKYFQIFGLEAGPVLLGSCCRVLRDREQVIQHYVTSVSLCV